MILKRLTATILVGITAGLLGMGLALLLHALQTIAFGTHSADFLRAVENASPERRLIVVISGGLLGGIGWWLLYHFGKPLVSISQAVQNNHPMPPVKTVLGGILQITSAALGSPLGREVAPRELGALSAQWLCKKFDLTPADTRTLIACGAGAGLAAIYNVPLAGALFALEVILRKVSLQLACQAFFVSGLAVLVSWIGLKNQPAYHIAPMHLTVSLIVWSLIAGLLLNFLGVQFKKAAQRMKSSAPKNWRLPVFCFINFALLGILSVYYPALLGNGKSPARLEFDHEINLWLTGILLILRIFFTLSTVRTGLPGGLLTPSLAIGALLSALLGAGWNMIWPGSELNAFAIIGAAVFLGAAQSMPVTSAVMIFEFTRMDLRFALPVALAIGIPWLFQQTLSLRKRH
ncbi:MAG: chloride channel protein [Myxococcota bacterium]